MDIWLIVLLAAYLPMAYFTAFLTGRKFVGSYRTGINRGLFWPVTLPIMTACLLCRCIKSLLEDAFYRGRH